MSNFIFYMMTTIMRIFVFFRDKKGEVLLTGIKNGDVVLDYGCGIGFSTEPAAEIVGNKGKVYALDIHPLAIKTIEKIKRNKGLTNIETILSGLDTGLSDESIDIVLLYNVFPMIEKKANLIKELYRVLKPSGIISIKTGLGAKLYSMKKTGNVEKLMKDNGPLELKEKIGRFYVFQKRK